MSRYEPTVTENVSLEGIGDLFGRLGNAISKGWKNMQRNNALSLVRMDTEYRPEINGVSYKTYSDFINSLKAFAASGEDFDATVNVSANVSNVECKVRFDTEDGPIEKTATKAVRVTKTAVIVRRGDQLHFRLPGYETGDSTPNVMAYVYADAGLR